MGKNEQTGMKKSTAYFCGIKLCADYYATQPLTVCTPGAENYHTQKSRDYCKTAMKIFLSQF